MLTIDLQVEVLCDEGQNTITRCHKSCLMQMVAIDCSTLGTTTEFCHRMSEYPPVLDLHLVVGCVAAL